jgi:hypothetical protein
MRRRITVAVAMGLAALAGVGAIIVATASAEKEIYRGVGLVPGNVAALTSAQTRLAGVPSDVRGRTGDLAPRAGTVHRLGGGAVAWVMAGRICWSRPHGGGCLPYLPESIPKPLDWTVGDPDLVGAGAPPRVWGIATDEVMSVTAHLDDGRSVTVEPVGNFYDLELPDVPPWTKLTLVAELEVGTSYSERV